MALRRKEIRFSVLILREIGQKKAFHYKTKVIFQCFAVYYSNSSNKRPLVWHLQTFKKDIFTLFGFNKPSKHNHQPTLYYFTVLATLLFSVYRIKHVHMKEALLLPDDHVMYNLSWFSGTQTLTFYEDHCHLRGNHWVHLGVMATLPSILGKTVVVDCSMTNIKMAVYNELAASYRLQSDFGASR